MLTYTMRVLYIGLFALAFAGLMSACDQAKEPDPTQVRGYRFPEEKIKVPAWVTTGMETLDIGFETCRTPGAGSNQLARLEFSVDGAPGEPLTMELTNPKKPSGTTAKVDFCIVELEPQLAKPKITSEMRQECSVPGYFDMAVSLANGTHIADFKLNEIGYIELDSESINPRYDVELLTTTRRSMYAVFPHRAPGQDLKPLFAVEYNRDEVVTTRTLKASDDWIYSFSFAGGQLNLLPPGCLEGWPEYLRALGAEEDVSRAQVAAANAKKLAGEDCGSGG